MAAFVLLCLLAAPAVRAQTSAGMQPEVAAEAAILPAATEAGAEAQESAGAGIPEGEAGSATESTDVVLAVVGEMQAVLRRYGLGPLDDRTVQEVLVLALAQAADPGARLLAFEDIRRMEKLERGIQYATGLHLTRSNAVARVTRVEADSPAAAAGILPDDILTAIDGQDAASLHIAELTARLRGLEPATVALRVRTGEAEPRAVTLETVERQLEPVAESRDLPAELGYVRVNGLFPGAGAAVAAELLSMVDRGLTGVVLDMRGANGRDIRSAVDIAGLVAPARARLFSFRDAGDQDLEVHQAAMQQPLGIPLMILVDANTTGAAELLAATVQGSGRGAMLLGAPTGGDALVREQLALENGLVLYFATRRLVVGSRETDIANEPIIPDIAIDPDVHYPDYVPEAPVLTDRRGITDDELEARQLRRQVRGDIALTRAVDVLLGLKALNIHDFGDESDSER
jgi:carboxyl-terminal processing protease